MPVPVPLAYLPELRLLLTPEAAGQPLAALPAGFRNPWLDAACGPDGRPEDAYHAPPAYYRRLLAAAQRVPGVDSTVLGEVGAFIAERLGSFTGDTAVLVHGDIHFANLLWDGNRLSAVLDFECAQPTARDVELDTLLRYTREPERYRQPGGGQGPARAALADFPGQLAGAYPELFAHPRLRERLAVYEALWQLLRLLHYPPGAGPPDPWGRLKSLLAAGDRWTAW